MGTDICLSCIFQRAFGLRKNWDGRVVHAPLCLKELDIPRFDCTAQRDRDTYLEDLTDEEARLVEDD